MKSPSKCIFLLLPALLLVNTLFSQQTNNIKLFFEKVYVHTDRDYYAAGDDIWYQAYLVNAQTGMRINTSANLYVELISPVSDVMERQTIRLENGLGKGDIAIPANAASGNYHLRAYTNWMQNFSDNFIFEKKIAIAGDPEVKSTVPSRYKADFIGTSPPATPSNTNSILFFPEGGTAVTGARGRIALKAVDRYGKGVDARGKIFTMSGDSVASFTTTHAGMGSFEMTPLPGQKYIARGVYANNQLLEAALPVALATGYTLGIEALKPDSIYATVRAATASSDNRPLQLVVRSLGKKVLIKDSVFLQNGNLVVTIAKSSLPAGINVITLYDTAKHAYCERLFFIDFKSNIRLQVLANKPAYRKRDSAILEIKVTDAANQPVMTRMSLAVTDAGIIPQNKSNILSYLLLQSEIRGDIEDAAAYFDTSNPARQAQLDLLLQAQGWRQFLWRRLLDTSIVVRFMPEPGITISGQVQKLAGKKGLPDMNVTLYAQGSKGDKLFMTKTQPDGRYYLDGLPLYGPQDIRLSTRNSQLKREGKVLLDSLFGKPYPVAKISGNVFDTSEVLHNFWRTAQDRRKIMEKQDKNEKGELLNVTVIAQQKPVTRLTEDIGMKFGPDSFFNIKVSDGSYETVANYILHRYPGAYSSADDEGFFFYGDKGAKLKPRWVIDGQEDRLSNGNSLNVDEETGRNDGAFDRIEYFSIPILKVKSIYVVPIVNQNNRRIYVVHLSLLPGALDLPDFSILNASINGYYESREYYAPNFTTITGNSSRSDLRSTIFWVPMLQTDANGKATVKYANSDGKLTRVVVEGVTDSGRPVSATMNYVGN